LKRPDFFLVGAPKCGTTAMDHYLKQHPEVFVPHRKEPQFFGTDLRSPVFVRDEAEYLALFEAARGEKRVGETSVWSLYSGRAVREISRFEPDASVIAMLRNPVEMIPSLHSQFLYTGNEDIEDLKEALDAEDDRKRGRRVPRTATFVQGLFYRETARYAEQLERYFDVFGRERVQVILFDDLRRDTAGVYAETLRFLGVDPSFRPGFEVVNPNKRVRSKALRNVSKHPGRAVRAFARALVPRPARHALVRAIDRHNTLYEPSRSADVATLAQLRAEFTPEVERLGELLGRDLRGWVEPRPA